MVMLAPSPQGATLGVRLRLLANQFAMGFASGDGFWTYSDVAPYQSTAIAEYNALSPENALKWGEVHGTSQNVFDFTGSDPHFTFAQTNGMRVTAAGPLVWGQSLPAWLTGGSWTSSTLTTVMYQHIDTVVGRYAGKVATWEVVNEPINNTNFWPGILPNYIDLALRRAHLADPGATLILNDYNIEEQNGGSDSMYSLCQSLLSGGSPLGGVGFEFHLTEGGLNWTSVASNFARFAALGLGLYITELDVRIPSPSSPGDRSSQAAVYSSACATALAQPALKGITTWGFTDNYSWIPSSFPGNGEALPFDTAYSPKSAYTAMQYTLGDAQTVRP